MLSRFTTNRQGPDAPINLQCGDALLNRRGAKTPSREEEGATADLNLNQNFIVSA